MVENREYKSDVFSMLMENKENALQVYNALNGSSYSDPEQIEMRTLEKGISLSIRNDAAFIIDMNLSIYEHQSTFNPNMPLRSLKYFVTILDEMLGKRDLYSRKLLRIPTPHFAVFYNGKEKRPRQELLKLSASYAKPTEEPELELTCTVYNINPDQDKELLHKCEVLEEYMQFIETVRKYETLGVADPVEKAINECIRKHILEEFLRKRKTEVLKAMTIDMTIDRRIELIREEEREDGIQEGIQKAVTILDELYASGSITSEAAAEAKQKLLAEINSKQ